MSAPPTSTLVERYRSVPAHGCERDRLWEHSRNALGIARLLVHEGRPEPLVDTACRTAVEAAGRAALEQAGMRFDGDVGPGAQPARGAA